MKVYATTHNLKRGLCAAVVIAAIALAAGPLGQAAQESTGVSAEAQLAQQILAGAGVTGGLVVHLGCGSSAGSEQAGKLTAALRANDRFVVCGLDRDPALVAQARRMLRPHAAAAGLAGPVSFATLRGERLPFIDNSINLLVVEDPSLLGGLENPPSVAMADVMRALAPNGVAYVKQGGQWVKTVRPWPAEIDEWTHYLHGPDNNAVASDSAIESPFHLQWTGGPSHSKSHKTLTTVNVAVSGGGRLFYIADEGPTALPEWLPNRWMLVARDAFNGVALWRRPLDQWQPSNVPSRNLFPADLHRRLVAATIAGKDRVYATLGILGPAAALDAATGETVVTYPDSERTEEIVVADGVVYLVINNASAGEIDRRRMAYEHVEPRAKRIAAFRADGKAPLWEKSDADTDGLMPMTLAVRNGRLYFQNPRHIVALDARTGAAIWRADRPGEYLRPGWSSPTLVAYDKVVVSADRKSGGDLPIAKDDVAGPLTVAELVVFSAADGRRLWSLDCAEGCRAPTDVFGVGDLLWCGENLTRNEQDFRQAREMLTGATVREAPLSPGWVDYHHHRCYRDKATEKYILAGRTGVEFIDLKTGEITPHHFIRGNCKNGILPCNGMIYLPPDQCGCYIEGKLTDGFCAVAPKRPAAGRQTGAAPLERLEKGPAYGQPPASGLQPADSRDWPTYRADAARSGRAAAPVASALKQQWETALGGRLTPPVAADGRLFVASIDAHTVHALDAATGKALWSFVAGARVDSPPTIAGGLAVFGCRDGWVYALRASDGALAWRYLAAPAEDQLIADDQVESVWPVHGSVLIEDASASSGPAAVYCAAGRNSFLDGGVRMVQLELATGQLLRERTHHSRDPQTGKMINLYQPYPAEIMAERELPGVLPDVIASDGGRLFMRAVAFERDLAIQEEDPPHLFCSMGFLDDSWWERTYWIYGPHMYGGAAGVHYAKSLSPSARIMVCDEKRVYGYQDETFPSAGLFRAGKTPQLAGKDTSKAKRKKVAPKTSVVPDWRADAPLYAQGLALAGDTLYAAGPPRFDEAETHKYLTSAPTDDQPPAALLADALDKFEGRKGALVLAVNKETGAKTAEYRIAAPPVFDGLIAARGRLYCSTKAGTVVCMAGAE